MVTREQATATALALASRAAELLAAVDDNVGAMRLRDAVAIVREDAGTSIPEDLKEAAAIMLKALALLDRGGAGSRIAAARLQGAIDAIREVTPPPHPDHG